MIYTSRFLRRPPDPWFTVRPFFSASMNISCTTLRASISISYITLFAPLCLSVVRIAICFSLALCYSIQSTVFASGRCSIVLALLSSLADPRREALRARHVGWLEHFIIYYSNVLKKLLIGTPPLKCPPCERLASAIIKDQIALSSLDQQALSVCSIPRF